MVRSIRVIRKYKKSQFYNEELNKELKDLYKENEMLIEGVEKANRQYSKLSIELKNKSEELTETKALFKKRFYKLVNKLIDDNMKLILSQLSSENYTSSKDDIKKLIFFCKTYGASLEEKKINQLEIDLENEHEKLMKASFEKYEQLKINKSKEFQTIEVEVGHNISGEEVIFCPECGESIATSKFQYKNKYFCPNCNTELNVL